MSVGSPEILFPNKAAPFLKFSTHQDGEDSTSKPVEPDEGLSEKLLIESLRWENTALAKVEMTGIPEHRQEGPRHYLEQRDAILEDFRGKRVFIFLDYDGTLTPIVANPCEALLAPQIRHILYLLASSSNRVTVGIVTGRALSSVKRFVQITASKDIQFLYAASHGFHIEAAGRKLHHEVGSKFVPILKQAALEIAQRLGHIEGVSLEDNEFSVSVHYRNAASSSHPEVEGWIDNVLLGYPMLKKTRGKKVFEIRINVVWDKGKAVTWLLNALTVDPRDPDVRLVYIGDDLTDEDAFETLCLFDKSLSILVSDEPLSRPTRASLFVNDPSEVGAVLRDLYFVAVECHGDITASQTSSSPSWILGNSVLPASEA